MVLMSFSSKLFPVGLFGEQTNINFVLLSQASNKPSTGNEKSSPRGTRCTAMSLMSAATLYIPYEGSMVTALSCPGVQKIL